MICNAVDHVCCMFLAIACSGFTCTRLDKPSRRVLPHGDRRPEPPNGDLDDVAETVKMVLLCGKLIKNVANRFNLKANEMLGEECGGLDGGMCLEIGTNRKRSTDVWKIKAATSGNGTAKEMESTIKAVKMHCNKPQAELSDKFECFAG